MTTKTTQPVQHKQWCNDHDTDEYASKPCCTGVIYRGPTGAYVEVTEYDGGPQVTLYHGNGDGDIPPAEARRMAQALLTAADIADGHRAPCGPAK